MIGITKKNKKISIEKNGEQKYSLFNKIFFINNNRNNICHNKLF